MVTLATLEGKHELEPRVYMTPRIVLSIGTVRMTKANLSPPVCTSTCYK